ncbi:MAG TPA: NAD(+)/NADH kinase [Thermoguttaceae bacterium]|nr:NAD(+)/NADH kinase [Thermoguttaceae bacterium]
MTGSPRPTENGRSPLRVLLLGFGGRPGVLEEAERLAALLERTDRIVARDFSGDVDLSTVEADVAVVLGGDGSILHAARQMGSRQVPVIAVNLGRLGFLADVPPDEVLHVLDEFRKGRLHTIEHLMFTCELLRGGRAVDRRLGLNEVTVQNGAPFTMLDVHLYVDAELVTTYRCDGLIISTPVGSTAHNLAAGGPILRKDMQAFVVSPICPHTLTYRPVIDSADRVFELEAASPGSEASVVVDGRVLGRLAAGDRVRVRRADVCFKLVAAPGHGYYRTLREKLGWSGRFQGNDR